MTIAYILAIRRSHLFIHKKIWVIDSKIIIGNVITIKTQG